MKKSDFGLKRILKTDYSFSKVGLITFVLGFAIIGCVLLFSHATSPPGASLATCAGGTCTEGSLPSPTGRPASCPTTATPTSSGIPAGGWVDLGNISDGVQNECRYYAVYIPSGLTGNASVLVYAHGNLGCLDNTGDMTSQGLDQLANNNRLIVVNLMLGWSSSSNSCTRPGSWYHPNADYPDPGSNVPNDYSYIQTVVHDLEARMTGSITVDSQRIWYMGVSSGGGLATGIMCDDATSSLFAGINWNGVGVNVASTGGTSPTPINGTERCGGGSAPVANNKNFVVSWVTGGSGTNGYNGFCATVFTAGNPSPDGHCVPSWSEANSYLQSHFGCGATALTLNFGTPSASNVSKTYSGCAFGAGPGVQTISVPGSGDGYNTVDDTLNGATNTNGIHMQDIFDFFVNYGGPTTSSPGAKANVFVSPNGSDTGTNCKRFASAVINPDSGGTTLCASFDKAYHLASQGDTVGLLGGTYPSQRLTYDSSKTGSAHVVFQPYAGAVVHSDTIDLGYDPQNISSANHVTLKDLILDNIGASIETWSTTNDVLLQNLTGHALQLLGGSNLQVKGGDWGKCTVASAITTNCTSRMIGTNVTIDGANFHDVVHDLNQDPNNLQHTEGIFVRGCANCTINHSKFWHNTVFDVFLQNCCNLQANQNVAIMNSWFAADGTGTTGNTWNGGSALEVTNSIPGFKLIHNSFAENTGPVWSFNTQGDSWAGTNALTADNLYVRGTGDCAAGMTYRGNVYIPFSPFTGQQSCDATEKKASTFGYVNYTQDSDLNYHLSSSSAAIGAGTPQDSAAAGSDIDGDIWPTSGRVDAGADESMAGGVTTPAPTVSITASPSSITSGSSSTLTWTSTNATSCTASGSWSGTKATNGSQPVSPTSTSTYSLSCSGAGGTTPGSATVTVTAAPSNPSPPTNPSPPSNPTPTVTKKGDCNGDNVVNLTDLSILLSHYGQNYSLADFDNNSLVSLIDLSILLSNYGE